MHLYFDTPEFDAQLLRAIGYTYYQGADIGECMTTAAQIKAKDCQSWFEEWYQLAERIEKQGCESLSNGCNDSAKQSFLRASNYYRTAFFFLYGAPPHANLIEAYDKHVQCFSQAIALFSTPVEAVHVPYGNTSLPGYFYKCDDSDEPRPTLIANGGYDSTHQEGYFFAAAAALARGYHVICFDGPGQGDMLIKQGIPMCYEWERVITPVVDYLMGRNDVQKEKIALLGPSWGGFLAARAAAFEHRIAALVVNPGQFDAMISIRKALPDVMALLENDPEHLLGKYLGQAMQNPSFAMRLQAKMWIHGFNSAVDLLKSWQHYHLRDVVTQISCPTLVMDSENESLSAGQAKIFFDHLTCPKEYLLFTAREGAGEHCEAGASSLAHQRLFDWLHKIIYQKDVS